ncbi:MAG: hypothetical protein EAY75_11075 [Bacteroidetes bacterium]|nr:MAG: hypothetical protein EAY75_11075 [Bacteroidota bacterium]
MKIALCLCLLGMAVVATAQPELQKKAAIMWRVIEKNHYQPPACNDEFSGRVFDAIIEKIDPWKFYLTAEEMAVLQPFRQSIDDEIRLKSWSFLAQLEKKIQQKYKFVDSTLATILGKPMNFSGPDKFGFGNTEPLPKNTLEQTLRITRYAKWLVLNAMLEPYDNDSSLPAKAVVLKREAEARQKVLANHQKRIARRTRLGSNLAAQLGELYLKAIAEAADPHTEYFPPQEKADFDEQLNSEKALFGFSMGETDEGKFKITGITPGSSAWNSGDVHQDDELLEIKTTDGTTIAASAEQTDKLNKLFENEKLEQVTLTLRGTDGKVKSVPLQKTVVQNEENLVQGFVLEGEKRIGYIQLPSFYTTWSGPTKGTSCADDVAQEIVKLKAEKLDGLILDLRYNGGGSMGEAIDLAGIFIDAGPMCLLRHADMKPLVYKDQNRGTIYDGPLAIMINSQSASASELVAGTLQDYNRAVVVGSSSFGKATAQNVFPVDTTAQPKQEETALSKQYGYVKTTVGKLYRITGATAQLSGVVPQIALPDAFEAMDGYSERSMKYALPSDTVMKTIYYTPLSPLSVAAVQAASKQRVQQSAFYKTVQQQVNQAKQQQLLKTVPLQYESYQIWHRSSLSDDDTATQAPTAIFKASAPTFYKKTMQGNAYWTTTTQYVINDLETDAYIEETYQVLKDLITNIKKN